MTTAFLRGTQEAPEEVAYRDTAIHAIIKDLDALLSPFVIAAHAIQRQADLIAISKRAQKLGRTLFSQPARWEFEWRLKSSQRSADEQVRRGFSTPLVIFPGLWRFTDNAARRLERPVSIMEPKLSHQG